MSRKNAQAPKPDDSAVLAMRFGQTVRNLRTAAGFSQEGFALECGVHRTYMGLIERGKVVVSIYTASLIANGLGIPLASLFEETECGSLG